MKEMYKQEIKVMDCTVRDGGLMNKWQFSDDFVRGVYNACVEAGIDYMEIGYLSSEKAFDRSVYGPWKFCHQKDLERIVGKNETNLKLSAMADIGRIELDDIPMASDSLLDMIKSKVSKHFWNVVLCKFPEYHRHNTCNFRQILFQDNKR